MNKFFTLSLFTLFTYGASAQDFSLVYEPTNPDDYIIIRDLATTSDDHMIVGYDMMHAAGTPQAGIMKTAADGSVIWSKTLEVPTSGADCTFEVAEKDNGNFYLWGLSKEVETDNRRAILSEISSDGEMLWSKEYNFGAHAIAAYTINKLEILPSGDLQMMIAIYTQVIVIKASPEGDIIWANSSALGPPDDGGKNPGFEWLAIPDDGGMCASKAGNDFSLLRYSEEGELEWNKTYSLGSYTHGKTLARSPNGNILVAGFIDYVPHIMEISDDSGDINWVKTIPASTLGYLGKAHLSVVGEDIIFDYATPGAEHYLLKMDEEGNILEAYMTKTPVMDYNKLEFVPNGETYFYGSVKNELLEYDGLIQRTSNLMSESCILTPIEGLVAEEYTAYSEAVFTPYESDFSNQSSIEIGLTDQPIRAKYACEIFLSDEVPMADQELTVYPNPSNGGVTVNSPASYLGGTYLISDLTGKTVFSGSISQQQMSLDATGLSNGTYLLQIQSEGKTMTQKISIAH